MSRTSPYRSLTLTLGLGAAAMLAACQAPPALMAPTDDNSALAVQAPWAQARVLRGQVQWPEGRRLAATTADVASSASVTLLDGDGLPVVAGLANAAGDFTLFESTTPFTPSLNQTFTLEVARRGATDGSRTLLSLRTLVQYTDAGWTSVTGTAIKVSALTTAVSQLEAEDDTVEPAGAIGMVNGTDVTPFGVVTAEAVETRRLAIVTKLADDIDPNQILVGDVGGAVVAIALSMREACAS